MIKSTVNSFCKLLGVRIVNANWGPRGFATAFEEIKRSGVSIQQIVDIGASNGQWTRECQTIWPAANYFMVDPLAENKTALAVLKQRNSRLDYFSGALSSAPGEMELLTHGDQSSFHASEFSGPQPIKTLVPVETLDQLVSDGRLKMPDLIKMDVQGHELEVFRGATKSLESCTVILVETNIQQSYENIPFLHEISTFLGDFGFRFFDFCTYVQRPFDMRLTQMDVVFAKGIPELFSVKWK